MIYRVGITGSDEWVNKTQIKDTIFKLKKQFGSDFVIYTRGSLKGVDHLVKKYSLEFDCSYAEFTPSHLSKTLYSVNQRVEAYNQPYSGRDIYRRSKQFVSTCQVFIIFKYEDDPSLDYILKEITKVNKKFKLFETHEAVGFRRD